MTWFGGSGFYGDSGFFGDAGTRSAGRVGDFVYWLANVGAYNSAPVTLRFADRGLLTGPDDNPAHEYYADRIRAITLPRRDLFSDGTMLGRSKSGYGELILANGDGGLDYMLDYGVDGLPVLVYRGRPRYVFPSAWRSFAMTCDGVPEDGIDSIRLRLRPTPSELETPFQRNLYAGDNVLPDGLEGGPELEAKPKPFLFGGPARNVPAVAVNPVKLIYQFHDGPLESVEDVFDDGQSLRLGLAWTAQTSGFGTDSIRGVAYGEGIIVAVGDAGKLFTSTDGETWTARTSQFGSLDIYAVAYGDDGYFLAVGETGTISSSPDGITWTQEETGLGAGNFLSVAYGNGVWVVGGTLNLIYSSDDRSNWTNHPNPFSGNIWDLTFAPIQNNPLFIGVGAGGEIGTSPDGDTWTAQESGTTEDLLRCAYGAGVVLVGGGDLALGGSPILLSSTDASSWTPREIGFGDNAVTTVDYGSGVFLVGGENGKLSSSYDKGETWTARQAAFGTELIQDTTAAGDLFIIVGDNGTLTKSEPPGQIYASEADLLDDTKAPAPGTYKVYPEGGYVRLGWPPIGRVTGNPVAGATAADRTHAQAWTQAATKAGKTSTDWSTADITAADAANASVVALWIGPEDRPTTAEVMDMIAQSFGAWWGTDDTNLYRFQRIEDPASKSVDLSLAKSDALELERLIDRSTVVPPYETIVRYDRNYSPLGDNLAPSVSEEERSSFTKEWREKKSTDLAVLDKHTTSKRLILDGLYVDPDDAEDEAIRVQALRGAGQTRYRIVVEADDETMVADLGKIAELTYDRFGLDAGKNFYVSSILHLPDRNMLLLNLWG